MESFCQKQFQNLLINKKQYPIIQMIEKGRNKFEKVKFLCFIKKEVNDLVPRTRYPFGW